MIEKTTTPTINGMIKGIRVFKYTLPFKTPVHMGNKTLDGREGWIIELSDEDGNKGYGEIAPLEGFSKETIVEARQQLLPVIGYIQYKPLPANSQDVKDFLPGVLPRWLMKEIYPSVTFGVETAVFELLEERLHVSSITTGETLIPSTISVNSLLHSNVELNNIQETVKEMVRSGFKAIKMKIGRDGLNEVKTDIERVRIAARALPNDAKLRLDANGLWNFETAVEFGKGIDDVAHCIEYIEEPFTFETWQRYSEYYEKTGIPVACDESLPRLNELTPENGDEASVLTGVKALILKPTLIGSIRRISELVELAKKHEMRTVFSSSFECGPGFTAICRMIGMFDLSNVPSGLDTLKYMEEDLFTGPVPVKEGCIVLREWMKTRPFYNIEAVHDSHHAHHSKDDKENKDHEHKINTAATESTVALIYSTHGLRGK